MHDLQLVKPAKDYEQVIWRKYISRSTVYHENTRSTMSNSLLGGSTDEVFPGSDTSDLEASQDPEPKPLSKIMRKRCKVFKEAMCKYGMHESLGVDSCNKMMQRYENMCRKQQDSDEAERKRLFKFKHHFTVKCKRLFEAQRKKM